MRWRRSSGRGSASSAAGAETSTARWPPSRRRSSSETRRRATRCYYVHALARAGRRSGGGAALAHDRAHRRIRAAVVPRHRLSRPRRPGTRHRASAGGIRRREIRCFSTSSSSRISTASWTTRGFSRSSRGWDSPASPSRASMLTDVAGLVGPVRRSRRRVRPARTRAEATA